jgi:ATP-dependent DNA helicase RecQ
VLSGIAQAGERYGRRKTVAMLVGDVEALPEALARLSASGALREERPRTIEHWIDAACGAGLIRTSDDQYRTLSLTELGRDLMEGRAGNISMVRPAEPAPKRGRRSPRHPRPDGRQAGESILRVRTARPQNAYDNERPQNDGVSAAGVGAALRAWRIEQARRRGVPPYVIFHDRTLEAIASALPGSREELADLPGIGPAKLEAFGDAILGLVAAVRSKTRI